MKHRFSEEQIIQILQEGEAGQQKAEICRQYGISEWTYYRWRQQFQGLTATQAKRLKQLEQENERLKRLVADQILANEARKETLAKKRASVADKRHIVTELVKGGLSERVACQLVGLNGKLRDECLNQEVFWSARHAQVVLELWRQHYNEERPHSSLGYQTPAEMARAVQPACGQPEAEVGLLGA